MPSKVFINLKKEKQDKIIKAAVNEFSNYVYEDIQVKRIVEEAGIARGSFYQYFEDVEDLFRYVLSHIKESMVSNNEPSGMFIKHEDVLLMLEENFRDRIETSMSGSDTRVENLLMNQIRKSEVALNLFIETIGLIPNMESDLLVHMLSREHPSLDKKHILYIIELLFPGLKTTVERLLRNQLTVEEALNEISFKFELIRKGIEGINI